MALTRLSDFGMFGFTSATDHPSSLATLRDLSTATENKPLTLVGLVSSHTRPVECLDGIALSNTSATLYTADTMGVIKVWDLEMEGGDRTRWKSTLRVELNHHRTRINQMLYADGQLWTGGETPVIPAKSNNLVTFFARSVLR